VCAVLCRKEFTGFRERQRRRMMEEREDEEEEEGGKDFGIKLKTKRRRKAGRILGSSCK